MFRKANLIDSRFGFKNLLEQLIDLPLPYCEDKQKQAKDDFHFIEQVW